MALTFEHETPIELCRRCPDLVPTLLREVFGKEVPAYSTISAEDPNVPQLAPEEYRADTAVVLSEGGVARLAVVAEVQQGRDRRKRFTWPLYTAAVHARHECTTYLIVLALNRSVAEWARQEIATFQPGCRFGPLVVGPDDLPPVTDIDEARERPLLSALAAFLHGDDEGGEAAAYAAVVALGATAGRDKGEWLYHLFRAMMSEERLIKLEELIQMNPQPYFPRTEFERTHYGRGRADGKAEGEAKGEAKGLAQGLLNVLEVRGFALTDELSARIRGCTDVERLSLWSNRAKKAVSLDEIFG